MKRLRYLALLLLLCVVLSGCKPEHVKAVLEGALEELQPIASDPPYPTEEESDSPLQERVEEIPCAHPHCDDGECSLCGGTGTTTGSPCYVCYATGYCDWCEGEGEYPPGFDIEAVLRNDQISPSFKVTTCFVCGGSGACAMCGGYVNKTMPPAMAAGLLGVSGPLCAGCMDTWRCQACSGMGRRGVPDFGVKASRP